MNSQRSLHEVPGLPHVLIDGFRHKLPNVQACDRIYFLTHYHSDHYGGLTSSWNYGTIICSKITANFLISIIGVLEICIKSVDIGQTVDIPGASVTFLDANHCPGAVLLLFEIKKTTDKALALDSFPSSSSSEVVYHLHTGDMRYHPRMKQYDALKQIKIDKLYMDTTYANPKHVFASQDDSILSIVNQAKLFMTENPNGLILVSAYNIGKERVICRLQDELNLVVFMDSVKLKLMMCMDDELNIRERIKSGKFVTDPSKARIHICK